MISRLTLFLILTSLSLTAQDLRVEWFDHSASLPRVINVFSSDQGIRYSTDRDEEYGVMGLTPDGIDFIGSTEFTASCHTEYHLPSGEHMVQAGCLFDIDYFPSGVFTYSSFTDSVQYDVITDNRIVEHSFILGADSLVYMWVYDSRLGQTVLQNSAGVIYPYNIENIETFGHQIDSPHLFSVGTYRPFLSIDQDIVKLGKDSLHSSTYTLPDEAVDIAVDFDLHQIYVLHEQKINVIDSNLLVVASIPLPIQTSIEMEWVDRLLYVLGTDAAGDRHIWSYDKGSGIIATVMSLGQDFDYIDFTVEGDSMFLATDRLVHKRVIGQDFKPALRDLRIVEVQGKLELADTFVVFPNRHYHIDLIVENVGDIEVQQYHVHALGDFTTYYDDSQYPKLAVTDPLLPGELDTLSFQFEVHYGPTNFTIAIPGADYRRDAHPEDNSVGIIVSSTEEVGLFQTDDIRVFPNPSSTTLYIDTDLSVDDARIFNLSGQLVEVLTDPTGTVDVSTIRDGIYVLQITAEGTVYQHKVFINH